MDAWNFSTKVYTGLDSFDKLKELKEKNIFIVCDPFLSNTDGFKEVLSILVQEKNRLNIYSKVSPDPPIEDIIKCMGELQEFNPNIVIAIGGGSAIDLTKGVLYFSKKISSVSIDKFIAIPTTSGTGSEVTNVAVITDKKKNVKYPIVDDQLIPDEAILNPSLVLSTPQKVTAYSGMDVLTHALEALVATNANLYTDSLAEKAIEIVFNDLIGCYKDGTDIEKRMRMHEASCLAGLAFNFAGLGISHALAHQVGGQMHVPHGLANTMLLPYVILCNAKNPAAKNKYVKIAKRVGPNQSRWSDEMVLEEFSRKIKYLAIQMNCPLKLSKFGVDKETAESHIAEIVRNAKKDITFKTNPIKPTDKELEEIYYSII
ncbi:iron-containing alcohol dehydrogenase [Desemzia sp. C1]|uniref:1-propanol dehydrogenase PduQ n=1 Tax=Desemzia sp. C1 TaxID=2892016 RepID=UPI001E638703|nr:1-propanol dehydrogenase PduQ [Desemzia sp. C1]MCI3029309.1 iron-containing alcohol dehydrogenase [Desemzia sp. C1]